MNQTFFVDKPFLRTLFYASYSLGVAGFLLGSIISFFPGAGRDWHLVSAALLLAGLFTPQWPVRITTVILFFICLFVAAGEHRHGIEYQKKLQQHQMATGPLR